MTEMQFKWLPNAIPFIRIFRDICCIANGKDTRKLKEMEKTHPHTRSKTERGSERKKISCKRMSKRIEL